MPALYDERRRIGSATRGYPLKLGLNSLYGKMAQRTGRGPYHDVVAAGLITAMTRAHLIEAVGLDPEAVVMLATDAVFSTRPLPLDIGNGLGQWEEKAWPDLFIAQTGVYWSPSDTKASLKSRGAPRSFIGDAVPEFQSVFAGWITKVRQTDAIASMLHDRQLIRSVPVKVRAFIGCRLGLAWGKPSLAGTWKDNTRQMSFEWRSKRDAMRVRLDEAGCLVTFPIVLSPFEESEVYKPANFDRLIEIAEDGSEFKTIGENMLLEAQPDFMPWLPRE